MSEENIFKPINKTGDMPVPDIFLQHIFTSDREARRFSRIC